MACARGAALRDRSCSGATTRDLSAPQVVLDGANPPQLDGLDAGVTTASLQIGGNNIGFTEILVRCAAVLPLGTPCQTAYASAGTAELRRRIEATAPKVTAALAEVRRRAPQPGPSSSGTRRSSRRPSCGAGRCCHRSRRRALPPRRPEQLNAMLANQAAGPGATYVDVYTPASATTPASCRRPLGRAAGAAVPVAPVHPNVLGTQGMAAT